VENANGAEGSKIGEFYLGRVERPINTGIPSVTDQASERALSGESVRRSHWLEPLETARLHHSRIRPLIQSQGRS
jgi:hypothetical protein